MASEQPKAASEAPQDTLAIEPVQQRGSGSAPQQMQAQEPARPVRRPVAFRDWAAI